MKKRTGQKIFSGKNFPQKLFIFIGKPFFLILLFLASKIEKLFPLFQKLFSLKIKITLPTLKISLPKARLRRIKILYPPKPPFSPSFLAFILGTLLAFATLYYFVFTIFQDLPSPLKFSQQTPSLTTKIYDRQGKLLYKIYKEQNRTPIKLSELPDFVIKAVISIEDKEFYRHRGISLKGIFRAAYLYLFQGKTTGGSTITQQLVKNSLLNSEKTLRRKIKEAILALLVEKKYTKEEILEMYLNQVGFGGATYGIEEASQKFFAKPASQLTLPQAALLAGLIASPTRFSPFGAHPELAKERQKLVLQKMLENNYLTKDQYQQALTEKIEFAPQRIDIKAPHFVMYVKDLLAQKYGEKLLETGGLEITTSLDLDLQETAQKIVAEEIKKLGNLHITNGAALITNPKTGEILAMVGSKDYFAQDLDGNVNVTLSLRQPGSSIKPVNYSLALENGFTPATLLDDSPITYHIPGQLPYSPKNYDNRYHGLVPLRVALGSSYNIPAVKVLASLGVDKMIERGREMGITTWDNPSRFGLSLTLGGGEVKMIDMAVVYGVLANNGVRVDLNPILEVKDSQGKILEKNSSGTQTPVLSPGVAYLLTHILADNSARTPAFGPSSQLYIPNRQVAVKTGTTQNLRDNWTIGYTPSRLVAVWVGNNDGSPMSWVASGVTGASPIWRKIMDKILENSPVETFTKPEEVIEVEICATTNTLPCSSCPAIKKELFLINTQPQKPCSSEMFHPVPEKSPSPQIL